MCRRASWLFDLPVRLTFRKVGYKSAGRIQYLLVISREHGDILYTEYLGIRFPSSLLGTSEIKFCEDPRTVLKPVGLVDANCLWIC